MAMVAVLAVTLIVTMVSLALIGLMNTDLTHASIQYAMARSFYVAQAGLEEARIQVAASPDPAAYTTPAGGVTVPYGSGRFTYWVDAGPATACGPGLKTLEVHSAMPFLARTLSTQVRACAVPGTPFLAALFGVSRIELAASRLYLAPYLVDTPGGGGALGSFTEINFSGSDVRLNALSDETAVPITLRDGRIFDYMLFGFAQRPSYTSDPADDPTPWILLAFGDIIKAQSTTGSIPNRCGTAHACLTVGNDITDIARVADLREAHYLPHVYVNGVREQALPPLALGRAPFEARAAANSANASLNARAGLPDKADSFYTTAQFYRIVFYLASHPGEYLRGTVYIDGSFQFSQNVNLGGDSGDVTLAVGGDLVIGKKVTVVNRHDLSTAAGRRTPGLVVLGVRDPVHPWETCGGQRLSEAGRFVMCADSAVTVDGLVYTQDGMAVEPGASVDQIGAVYNSSRGTPNPSFTVREATVVLRFDPLALSAFGTGIAVLSWQQLP